MSVTPPDAPARGCGVADPGDTGLTAYVWGGDPGAVDDDRVAVVNGTRGPERTFTYRALGAAVSATAGHLLRRARVGRDDVVAVAVHNSAEFIVAYHGVLAAGATVLTLDPRATPREHAQDIAATGARALIAEVAVWRDLTGHDPATAPLPAVVIGAGGGADGTGTAVPWEEVLGAGPAELPDPGPGGARTAVLASSSGTQGTPKKVRLTHRNLVANLAQIAELHRLDATDVVLSVPPLRHIYGMQMAMNPALRARSPLILPPTPFSADRFLATVEEHRVTVAYAVPSVIAELADAADGGAGGHDYSSLRMIVSGGAPLPRAAADGCSRRLGRPVVQGFGMTEGGCVSFTPDGAEVPPESVGIVMPGTEVRLTDPETGAPAPPGAPGELWLRGPQLTPGYLNNPEATTKLLTADGWMRTGDVVTVDADGFLSIVGRSKSLIKYKGHQVAPAELERILFEHPAVTDAAVVGHPDPVAGELPKAYVVLGGPATLWDITGHVASRVAPHKRIRLIERVRAITRSDTGKVRRTALDGQVLPPAPDGLRVMVTGGAKGLGLVIAEALSAAGAAVLLTGRDRTALEETAERMRAQGRPVVAAVADVTDRRALAAAIRTGTNAFGGIDVLVNNAGLPGPVGVSWEVDEDDWWRAVEVNLRGSALATRLVLPGMIARRGGRVITIVSKAGRTGWPGASAYAASKAALINWNRTTAAELRGTGVGAFAFDPGLLDIGMTRSHLDRGHTGREWEDRILEWTLLAREKERFASLPEAADAVVRIARGAADRFPGQYLTARDLEEHFDGQVSPGTVAGPAPAAVPDTTPDRRRHTTTRRCP
ncbi:SDR family NAD(P)-dependent oxidoreductase [Streptomyces flaveolus]|uniref:SDR family NAD(P)-dependent oxidoreductase n=1 Tax=Streptomyces flaveolus TaxID=67297 RepID=UPI0034207656